MNNLFASVIRTAGENIIWTAAVVAALGLLYHKILRPGWQRGHAALRLLERELSGNGGSSMKDKLDAVGRDVRAVQHATGEVLDQMVSQHNREHDDLWAAFASLGIDRRKGMK